MTPRILFLSRVVTVVVRSYRNEELCYQTSMKVHLYQAIECSHTSIYAYASLREALSPDAWRWIATYNAFESMMVSLYQTVKYSSNSMHVYASQRRALKRDVTPSNKRDRALLPSHQMFKQLNARLCVCKPERSPRTSGLYPDAWRWLVSIVHFCWKNRSFVYSEDTSKKDDCLWIAYTRRALLSNEHEGAPLPNHYQVASPLFGENVLEFDKHSLHWEQQASAKGVSEDDLRSANFVNIVEDPSARAPMTKATVT